MSEALAESDVTGDWRPAVRVICPRARSEPEPCDCGFVGDWEHRWVYVWHDVPGHRRGDRAIRRDIAKGFPARANDEGWWVADGFDERCPQCGDIERFDNDANRVAQFAEHAKVVVFMDARR